MLINKEAPDFTADAVYPNGSIAPFTLSSLRGKYVVLFFYPMDFSAVCPTEILAFDSALDEFSKLSCTLVSVSTDSAYSHCAWRKMDRKQGGLGNIRYPMVADMDKNIARSYNVLLNGKVAVRGLFLLDREGVIQHITLNPLYMARNVEDVLRVLAALQFHEKHGQACPANWHQGEPGIR